MSDITCEIDNEMRISGLKEKQNLPNSLREWFVLPDEWVMERDANQMQNDLLRAERDELIEYVRKLKMLTIYLITETELSERNLSSINFDKAEKHLPGYLRKEIDIDMQTIGIIDRLN